ncbi:hypothetical protein TNCV_874901 [Trichonephila clavipes]|nr:hypothetical protein TNCV_874901 [Trichonephila clavipes]
MYQHLSHIDHQLPVASPSHEQSQDTIYDSLPPMEQSTVPKSPLKEPMEPSRVPKSPLKDPVEFKPLIVSKSPDPSVKKVDSVIHCAPRSRERRNEERRKEKRRNEERRPRDNIMYRRPYFSPSYQRYDFKPRVFTRPPYEQQLMPISQENAQVLFHSQGLAVLCIRNNGFTLTNGVVPYAMDRECPNELFKFLHYLNVGTICVTDQHSKHTFKEIQASWSSSSQFKRTPVMLLNSNGYDSTHILFKSIKEDSSRRFTSVDASLQCTMDQIDAFPEHISTIVVPVTLPEKPDAFGICRSEGTSPCLHHLSGTQHETSFCLVLQRQLVLKKEAGG